jgi:hypothetical protein
MAKPPESPSLNDACDDGEHVLIPGDAPGVRVCRHCGLSCMAIVDVLEHDFGYWTED